MIKYKPGDIVSIPLSNGEFIAAQVLLDINNQCQDENHAVKRRTFFTAYSGCALIDIFSTTFSSPKFKDDDEVLLAGLMVGDYFIRTGKWEIVGRKSIPYKNVDFPESINTVGEHNAVFSKGEIQIPLDLEYGEGQEMELAPSNTPSVIVGDIALYYLGRKDEIVDPDLENPKPEDYEYLNLGNDDLRHSKHRERIYKMLGEPVGRNYYEWAKEKGFDLKRFYD